MVCCSMAVPLGQYFVLWNDVYWWRFLLVNSVKPSRTWFRSSKAWVVKHLVHWLRFQFSSEFFFSNQAQQFFLRRFSAIWIRLAVNVKYEDTRDGVHPCRQTRLMSKSSFCTPIIYYYNLGCLTTTITDRIRSARCVPLSACLCYKMFPLQF